MIRKAARVMIVAATVWLTGCATATILKEDAKALTEATDKAVGASRTFYADLEKKRRDFLLEVIANDRNCDLAWSVVLLPDDRERYGFRCLTREENTMRADCLDDAARRSTPACQRLSRAFDVAIVGEQSSALLLVEVMAKYQLEIAKILQDPKYDATAALTNLQGQANSIKGLIDALDGKAPAPLDFKDQIKAIGAFADLVARAAEDSRDLDALRKLMSGESDRKFREALDVLIERYENLDARTLETLELAGVNNRLRSFNAELGTLKPGANYDPVKRADKMRELAEQYAQLRARQAQPDVLAKMLGALRDSHVELRNAVVDGKLSTKQRKRIAAENMRRLKTWLDAATALVRAF